ncbi:Rhamnan synthesis protein F [Cribrihabitans marinus]|uniref:Rhamnan synthesis protein F n=1 Tax=Cribrihabitans marinus TaxID=1227549 RepID=A0A1H7D6X2_9RHOB|nr:rhamnan synthesis F family protein [Cribrihabitans marinus]GGH37742.1 glycosyl transferase [Cribrihabitans marinus]SEJ97074.1 Rhamnan synthesis protein F [Cribrihabitans marinus]
MSLDDLWQEILAETGHLEQRPDFRFDPAFYGARHPDLVATGVDLRKHFESHGKTEGRFANAYQETLKHVPDLNRRLADITVDPRLRAEIEAETDGVFELIFELLSLGDPIDRMLSHFSEQQYFQAYPDVQKAGLVALHHFTRFGITEGRRSLRDIRENQFRGSLEFDRTKPTCCICVHQLTKTGAPIVALGMARGAKNTHNVIIMSLEQGPLLAEFQSVANMVVVTSRPDEDFDFLDLPNGGQVDFAILNSAASFLFAKAFIRRSIPYANYIHEFTDYIPVRQAFWSALFSDLMVFISEKMRQNWTPMLKDMRFDVAQDSVIIPQRVIQRKNVVAKEYSEAREHLSRLIGVDCRNRRVVYGVGFVDWRKGTDLFVLTAQMARKRDPDSLFVWVGDGLNHEHMPFGVWLDKHMREAGANDPGGNLFFLPTGQHYLDVCRASDVLFLPSRSDPQPNVVFEAMQFGARAVLFEKATSFDDDVYAGIDELQRVEYGDLVGACDALLSAPMKQPARIGLPSFPRKRSDADVFQSISQALNKRLSEQRHFVAGGGDYDIPMLFTTYERDREARRNEREKMWSYNRLWVWRSSAQAEAELAASDNWVHQNCRIERFAWSDTVPPVDYSVHIHAHYLDNLGGDLLYYRTLHEARRIVVTTDSTEKADRIAQIGRQAGIGVETIVVPNKGRDILPFMQLFANGHAQEDEIWCHVHQKKSLEVTDAGETWRRFLMAILLGDDTRFSAALELVAAPETGLVTAFDPGVSNWAGSRRLLPQIAPRLPGPIPEHALLFPVGNMFWTRGRVVAEMNGIFGENYPWPNEPIATDGTVYHLIERLWPAASAMAGLNAVFLDKPDQKRV